MNTKRLTVSVVATILAFAVNIGMSFFLTPFVVKNIGSEAYGFVSLAQNFTNYAQIITVALNSMAGRYITIAYHNGNKEEAQQYLTSALCGNIVMCIFLSIPAIVCVLGLEKIVNITPSLIGDVKILFALIFFSFFVTLINSSYATATFISNRKDLEAKRNIESYIIKVVILIGCYILFKPKVLYVGIASAAMAVYVLAANIRYLRKLTPDLKIKRSYYSSKKVVTLVKSGAWNSFGSISDVFATELDLLITNLFISSTAMGTLSIAKQLPGVIQTLIGTVAGVFAPNYMIAYAKNDKIDLMSKIRQSIIIVGILANICMTVLLIFGKSFFALWMPSQDANQLQLLSILTVAGFAVNGGVQCIFQIYTMTNKIRANAIVGFVSNIFSICIVFVLLKHTNLGIYAVAGVSTVVAILRNLCFSVPYAAHCIKINPWIFYKPILINLISIAICSVVGMYIVGMFTLNSWVKLIIAGIIVTIIVFIINFVLVTNREEKKNIYRAIKTRF